MVIDLCHVPISIEKYYQDIGACNEVDMNACHILLERPQQHDVDATHRGHEANSIYMFNWKGKRVVMRPIPPTLKYKKKKSKFVCVQSRRFFCGSKGDKVRSCFIDEGRNYSTS